MFTLIYQWTPLFYSNITNQRKNVPIRAQKRLIGLMQKDWSKRWWLVTSNRCPDHLSRQFLTTASTFHTAIKIPQPNIFTHYQRDLPSNTHSLTHIDKHTHSHKETHTLVLIDKHTLTHTHTTHTQTHTHRHTPDAHFISLFFQKRNKTKYC